MLLTGIKQFAKTTTKAEYKEVKRIIRDFIPFKHLKLVTVDSQAAS